MSHYPATDAAKQMCERCEEEFWNWEDVWRTYDGAEVCRHCYQTLKDLEVECELCKDRVQPGHIRVVDGKQLCLACVELIFRKFERDNPTAQFEAEYAEKLGSGFDAEKAFAAVCQPDEPEHEIPGGLAQTGVALELLGERLRVLAGV